MPFHSYFIFSSCQNIKIRTKKNLLTPVAKEATKAAKAASTSGQESKEKRDLGGKRSQP